MPPHVLSVRWDWWVTVRPDGPCRVIPGRWCLLLVPALHALWACARILATFPVPALQAILLVLLLPPAAGVLRVRQILIPARLSVVWRGPWPWIVVPPVHPGDINSHLSGSTSLWWLPRPASHCGMPFGTSAGLQRWAPGANRSCPPLLAGVFPPHVVHHVEAQQIALPR